MIALMFISRRCTLLPLHRCELGLEIGHFGAQLEEL
jgi:hypothetical protein